MNYKLQGISIRIEDPRPYKPSYLTELLANNIEIKKKSIVADIGTGCGILAILASKLGAKRVYAVDIDENCRKPIEGNSKINNAGNIEFLRGDMLRPLKEKADVIVASLPQMPSNKKIDIHRHGSSDGAKYNLELIKNAPKYLRKNGAVFFSVMSISNPMKVFKALREKFYMVIAAAKEMEFDKKKFDMLSEGLSDYILGLGRKNKSLVCYRNKKWYYVAYIIKAMLK